MLLVNRLSQHRSADVLQFLMDGNYLDMRTKSLTAELLTYNSDLHVMGYVKVTFNWKVDGSVEGELHSLMILGSLEYVWGLGRECVELLLKSSFAVEL